MHLAAPREPRRRAQRLSYELALAVPLPIPPFPKLPPREDRRGLGHDGGEARGRWYECPEVVPPDGPTCVPSGRFAAGTW